MLAVVNKRMPDGLAAQRPHPRGGHLGVAHVAPESEDREDKGGGAGQRDQLVARTRLLALATVASQLLATGFSLEPGHDAGLEPCRRVYRQRKEQDEIRRVSKRRHLTAAVAAALDVRNRRSPLRPREPPEG